MNRALRSLLLASALLGGSVPAGAASGLEWPAVTQTMRPWTRWWWLGSGVDRPNLQRMLQQLRDVGEGGVEICPIYGAKGYESRFIPYLSPKWMSMLAVTTETGRDLGIGVDLTTGTGWPMGGPWIQADDASENVTVRHLKFGSDGRIAAPLTRPEGAAPRPAPQAGSGSAMDGMIGNGPQLKILYARAVGPDGRQQDVSEHVVEGKLDWTAPSGGWTLYAVVARQPVQKVKRAAPGDEGNVIDPYSDRALDAFLSRFDRAFEGFQAPVPRAEFHDSFEYFGANWTPDFFRIFADRRGYDLRDHLPALTGDGSPDDAARVREDYRRTIAELHLEWVRHWTQWSHSRGSLTREQAHGAPANIEDVYAAADIPETEGKFGGGNEDQVPMLKFASSAAHVTGKTLASSETFTWLGEHFSVPLAQLKPVVDTFFLAGINHIFFHGTPYSPSDAPWPGWLFYAAVNFGPNGGIWHDLPAFNAYATRCQSILQGGKPDNDVLLYFPVGDFWQKASTELGAARHARTDPLVEQFTTPGAWMTGSPFHFVAMELWHKGYSYDEVTDDLLGKATASEQGIELGGSRYGAIVIPRCEVMPESTLKRLLDLAAKGGHVIFLGGFPTQSAGWKDHAEHDAGLKSLAANAAGAVLVGNDLSDLLAKADVAREPMTDQSLEFIRRRTSDSTDYFIVNRSGKSFEGWVPLAALHAGTGPGEGEPMESAPLLAALFDPMRQDRVGRAAVRTDSRSGMSSVYLQLDPNGSIIVRCFTKKPSAASAPSLYVTTQSAQPLKGTWSVTFTDGGPALPQTYTTPKLTSWTDRDDAEAKRFAGTATYKLDFDAPSTRASGWQIDLGKVCDSARVRLNGHEVATLWFPPFTTDITQYLQPGKNTLEVDVTNLAANRIADLDRRHVQWKAFYEINFVNHEYEPFDASNWPERDSGLLGPVKLIPTEPLTP